jgi:hypothetical protein
MAYLVAVVPFGSLALNLDDIRHCSAHTTTVLRIRDLVITYNVLISHECQGVGFRPVQLKAKTTVLVCFISVCFHLVNTKK